MRLTKKDAFATILVAAIVVPYVGYLVRGSMPFIEDPRGMAATGLILGLLALAFLDRSAFGSGTFAWIEATGGLVSLGLGIAALWAETNEALLGAFVVSIVIVWALPTLLHAGFFTSPRTPSTG